jgi:hypothetical protein
MEFPCDRSRQLKQFALIPFKIRCMELQQMSVSSVLEV